MHLLSRHTGRHIPKTQVAYVAVFLDRNEAGEKPVYTLYLDLTETVIVYRQAHIYTAKVG